jgi:poly-gamma-glutamate synthesis protein (capsule biosynthesis protein)
MSSSHRAGCPVALADLRLLRMRHWGFDGGTHVGEMVVHADAAQAVVDAFRRLYEARTVVERMRLVDEYGGDDDRSMAANNTSAYNCRTVAGTSTFSQHAYGRALDVNPVQNPYVTSRAVEPAAGRAYLDRSDVRPGMAVAGGPVVEAFRASGWGWGGDFTSSKDYQHFSANGR